jgi:hypothetical protein
VPHGYLSDEEGGEKGQMEFLAAQSEQLDGRKGPKTPEIKGPVLTRQGRDAQFAQTGFSCILHANPLFLDFPFDAKALRVPS